MQELRNHFALEVIYKQEVIVVPVSGQKLISIVLYNFIDEAVDLVALIRERHRHGQSIGIIGNRDEIDSSVAAEHDHVFG